MARSKVIEVGRQIGDLKVLEIRPSGADEMVICSCLCSRIVGFLKTEIAGGQKTCCGACKERKILPNIGPGEFAEMLLTHHQIPRGADVIVVSRSPGELVVEYMGKEFRCGPRDVKGLGVRI